jgi:hypothetical protein
VVINVIFNTCFGNIILHISKFYFKDFLTCNFELFGENFMKIITTGQIFLQITNYQGFKNNQVKLYEFLSLGN